jgi:hypothetical protein
MAQKTVVSQTIKKEQTKRPGRHRKVKLSREKKQTFFTQGGCR